MLEKYPAAFSGANMIKKTAVPPKERTQRLYDNMKAMNYYYQKDPYAKEFGVRVEDQWLQLDARVLEPPVLKYQMTNNQQKDADVPFKKVRRAVCFVLFSFSVIGAYSQKCSQV